MTSPGPPRRRLRKLFLPTSSKNLVPFNPVLSPVEDVHEELRASLMSKNLSFETSSFSVQSASPQTSSDTESVSSSLHTSPYAASATSVSTASLVDTGETTLGSSPRSAQREALRRAAIEDPPQNPSSPLSPGRRAVRPLPPIPHICLKSASDASIASERSCNSTTSLPLMIAGRTIRALPPIPSSPTQPQLRPQSFNRHPPNLSTMKPLNSSPRLSTSRPTTNTANHPPNIINVNQPLDPVNAVASEVKTRNHLDTTNKPNINSSPPLHKSNYWLIDWDELEEILGCNVRPSHVPTPIPVSKSVLQPPSPTPTPSSSSKLWPGAAAVRGLHARSHSAVELDGPARASASRTKGEVRGVIRNGRRYI